jgi:hypothetical protein
MGCRGVKTPTFYLLEVIMRLIIEDSQPLRLENLIAELERCDPGKKVVLGPGYMVPKLDYNVQRFNGGLQLEFGISSWDHHRHLRPKKKDLVPEVTVEQYLTFLKEIPGSTREWWKGGTEFFTLKHKCLIGLPGEVGLGIVGVFESRSGVTILSVGMWC